MVWCGLPYLYLCNFSHYFDALRIRLNTIFFCLFLSNSLVWNQNNDYRTVFGISISIQSIPEVIHFIAYRTNGQFIAERKIMTKKEFVNVASGFHPSIYNPERINYFLKYGIQCGAYKDLTYRVDVQLTSTIDSLWKIRYGYYPYKGVNEKGWAGDGLSPTAGQASFLYEKYGMDIMIGGYVIDTNLWNLLRDTQDVNWKIKYKGM
jgi:hypothetical protein